MPKSNTPSTKANTHAVQSHYDTFPYPTVSTLSWALPFGFKRRSLDWLLCRRGQNRLPRDAKVWIAGCGQQQASHWGMCFPEGDVLATDLSTTTLKHAQSLAQQLELKNVRFEQGNLMNPGREAHFDLIVSTGVIHHLPDPATGLANLRRALKPDGALFFMVYNQRHREPLAAFRTAFNALAGDMRDPKDRYDLVCRLNDRMLNSPNISPTARDAFELLRKNKHDRSFVADCLLQPIEHSYDVDSFLRLLNDAGFRMTEWCQPALWNLSHYVDDPELIERFAALDPVAQWRTINSLTGYAAPLFECLAEPVDAPRRAAFGVQEILSLPLQCRTEHQVVRVEEGRVVERARRSSFKKAGDLLQSTVTGPLGQKTQWQLPALTEPLLRAFDGSCPAGEVIARFADAFGNDEIIDLISALLPGNIGLLAPAD